MVSSIFPLSLLGALLASSASADIAYTARSLDMPGNDIGSAKAPRPDDCFGKCLVFGRCRAFTWTNFEGGTCFFKTFWVQPVISVGATSGVLLENNQAVFAPAYRGSFDNCDMPGFDLSSESGKDVEACDAACFKNPACKAVTWTSWNGGTCFYKSDVRACAPVAGAITRVPFNHFV